MWRRMLTLLICFAVLIPACRQKTEPQQKDKEPVEEQEPAVKAPPGMTVIEGLEDGPVFIRNDPVTVAEYQEFLSTIGRPIPEKWAEGNADLQEPITGLTLAQARQYATWQLASVPTAAEWRKATPVVGTQPYPWDPGAGPDAPRPNARLFLVQHYLPDSKGEETAKKEKEDLLKNIQSKRVDEIVALQDELDSQLKDVRDKWQSLWKEMKPTFFESLKSLARRARVAAKQDGRETVLRILQEVAAEKVKQINLKVNNASSQKMEEAAQEYRAFLKDNLQKVQEKVEGLKETRAKLDDQTLELKKKLEQAGQTWAQHSVGNIVEMRDSASQVGDSLSEALQAKAQLQKALKTLEQSAPDMEEMRQMVDSIEESARQAEQEAEKLAAQEDATEKIKSLKQKLGNLSEHLNKEFPQEQKLIDALNQLVESSAKVKALRAEVGELTSMLEKLGAGSGQQGG